MKRVLYAFLAGLGLMALAAGLDQLLFAEEFGLWAYTLGSMTGMGLALLGLVLSIGTLLFSRKKGRSLAIAALIILTGVSTFIFSLLLWLALGMPVPT